jgi:hypothetical protein
MAIEHPTTAKSPNITPKAMAVPAFIPLELPDCVFVVLVVPVVVRVDVCA